MDALQSVTIYLVRPIVILLIIVLMHFTNTDFNIKILFTFSLSITYLNFHIFLSSLAALDSITQAFINIEKVLKLEEINQ